jgi:ABC-2 type transport system permease protein
MSILHIASKDLVELLRNRMTFLFLLIMPIAFTFLFGFAFSGSGSGSEDSRLPVGLLNQDGGPLSLDLEQLLSSSAVVRLEINPENTPTDLEKRVADKALAAALIIPAGYGQSLTTAAPLKLIVFADTAENAGLSAQTEILTASSRLARAVKAADTVAPGSQPALSEALAAWQNPPVRLVVAQSSVVRVKEPAEAANPMSSFAHSAPGMMLQFAIAGLLTCAQVMVAERKNRCLQRMLTTSVNRVEILLGHFLFLFTTIFTQFIILIAFGQLFLQLDYFQQPLATLLVAFAAALCISALGLLIGVFAKSEEQAIIFSLVPMFVFAGLGGAWVPLEVTGATFQAIGHITPVAWAMDAFKGILLRGLDVRGVLVPAAALIGYAILFFALSGWRFKTAS